MVRRTARCGRDALQSALLWPWECLAFPRVQPLYADRILESARHSERKTQCLEPSLKGLASSAENRLTRVRSSLTIGPVKGRTCTKSAYGPRMLTVIQFQPQSPRRGFPPY